MGHCIAYRYVTNDMETSDIESAKDLLGRTFRVGDKVYINGSSKSTSFRARTVKRIFHPGGRWPANEVFVDLGRNCDFRKPSEVILSTPIEGC